MLRILFIARCPPYPLHLGDRLILFHLARELAARGHHLDLLAFADRPEDAGTDWSATPARPFFGHFETIPAPRRGPLSLLRRALLPGARWPSAAAAAWSPAMWRAIAAQVSGRPYDAIHLFGGVQVYEYWRALGGRPALITPYESYSLYLRRALAAARGPAWASIRLRAALARRYESWMFNPYKRVAVVSERDRDELRALNPALPLAVIPNGVDLAAFSAPAAEREPALLFVGNYEYPPNVDAARTLATAILPAVQSRVPAARLWLVGHAPPPALQALAGDAVQVTGRVPDVRPYLARAGVFVSPLRLGAGIKNKVLEALAMGCPVVATPISADGIALTHEHDALIADGPALAEAAARVLADPALAQRLAANGRALVERRYTWTHVADQYEELYAQLR